MDDLIRRSDAIRVANEIPELIENHCFGEGETERMMKEIPAVDAISLGVGTIQVERDTAIAQLAELGIGFGQKAPDMVEVVRCKDCKHRGFVHECPMCYEDGSYDEDYGYDYWDVDKTTDDGFCHCGEIDSEVEDAE